MFSATFGLSCAASVIGTPMLKKFGGRKMLLTGLMISTTSMATLVFSTAAKDRIAYMPYISIAAVVSFVLGVSVGPLLTFMSLMSELTTQTIRPNAVWVAGIIYWLLGSVVSMTSPALLEACGGFAYIPFVFLATLEVCNTLINLSKTSYLFNLIYQTHPYFLSCDQQMIYVCVCVPKTHRRHLADIQQQFMNCKLSSVTPNSRSDESEVFVHQAI